MEDWIVQLPKDVLSVVFSLLTLKEAGRTCVLSSWWKNLWTLTPHFSFDASDRMKRISDFLDSDDNDDESCNDLIERERREYIRWVNQVVDNHQGLDLDEFVIVFNLDARHSLHLDKWFSFAVKKRVKVIKIDLTDFCLATQRNYSFIRSAPILSGIECLTSLFLKSVDIPGETIEHLLSVCPFLEQLWVEWSKDLKRLRVVGSSLKLKYLGIIFCQCLKDIEICAPNLVSFHFGKALMIDTELRVKGLFSLADLFIDAMDMYADFALFSSYFSQLESLKLTFYYNYRFFDLLELPQLTNLKHLTFKIRQFENCMFGLVEFINLCPFLHKFTLELGAKANSREIRVDWGNSLPHQYLKVVEMVGFVGRGHEIKIAKFFLKNSSSLEKLIIDTFCEFLELDVEEVLTDTVAPGSREKAEELRSEVPPGVELLIL